MRSLICLALLIVLASVAGAGSIRPAACATDPTVEDANLKRFVKQLNVATCKSLGYAKGCTDAQVKAKDPTKAILPETAAGYQDYTTPLYCAMVHQHADQAQKIRAAQDIAARWLLASPALQDSIDASLPALP